MPDREAVIAANRGFYRAFESLELEQMEKVWIREQRIVCIHPGWPKLVGWGPIMNSWARIFDGVFEMKFELGEIDVIISGDLAVVIVEENLEQKNYDGIMRSQVLTTNIFERAGGEWLMVSHHGSPVLAPAGSEPQLQ
ncbi:MAG TPA: nuclear transport factor 2 family protein [Candidatus Binataceae bacterium]|nr:nuclear transport factor 2 family protein [Candidatus Binataceae bacterium]